MLNSNHTNIDITRILSAKTFKKYQITLKIMEKASI